MKQIYPNTVQNKERLTPASEKPVTQEQYEDLVRRTNAAEAASVSANQNVNALRTSLSNAVATHNVITDNITSDSANINCVCSSSVKANEGQFTNLKSCSVNSDISTTGNMHIDHCLDVGENISAEGTISSDLRVTAPEIATTSLTSTNALISNNLTVNGTFTAEHFNAVNPELSGTTCIHSAEADRIDADTVNVKDTEIKNAKIENAKVIDLTSTNNNLEFITHTENHQDIIAATNDQVIELPMFTNGSYYLEARTDGDLKLWSIEISNSNKNLMYRWSQMRLGQIKKVYDASFDDGTMHLFIVINSEGRLLKLYHQSTSTDNLNPPTIWDEGTTIPEPYREHEITDPCGTYMDKLVVTDTLRVEHLEMDWLDIDNASIYRNFGLTCALDDFGNPVVSTGEEHQYVAVSKEADGANLRPHWDTPVSNAVNGVLSNTTCLVAEKAISEYDGTIVSQPEYVPATSTKNDWTLEDDKYIPPADYYDENKVKVAYADTEWKFYDEEDNELLTITTNVDDIEGLYIEEVTSSYPIGHLNNTTCVEGDNAVLTSCNLVSCNSVTCCGTVCTNLEVLNALCLTNTTCTDADILVNNVANADECVSSTTLAITNGTTTYPVAKLKRTNECISVANCCDACMNEMPLTATLADGTVGPSVNLLVQNKLRAGCLYVDGDTHISGDLYVEGKTITQEEETISTGADSIVLRQNAATGLSNTEIAGVIVHNYDGNGNNTIVGIDNSGTVRVGDATGTDTTYTEIWLGADGKWYDTDGTTEITVAGELTAYASKTVEDNFTKYRNAVFTVFDITDLEPVATRAEATNMTDVGLTCWDAATKEIHTIAAPSAEDLKLVSCVDSVTGRMGYKWVCNLADQTSVYRFDSMSDYETYIQTSQIPTGSVIEIDNEDNWIQSEDID